MWWRNFLSVERCLKASKYVIWKRNIATCFTIYIHIKNSISDIWRFPYLCYKNGGGVFLIIYFISMLFCGIPVFLLEVSIGQYLGAGGMTTIAQICPILKGKVSEMCMYYLLSLCLTSDQITSRLELNEFLKKFLVVLHQDTGHRDLKFNKWQNSIKLRLLFLCMYYMFLF